MAIKDRGKMKWQGFFMPEHVSSLNHIWREDQKLKMPIFSEYQIEEFEERISLSMEFQLRVEFRILINGFEENITGFVHYVDHLKKQFNVRKSDGQISYVKFNQIMDVTIIE